MNHRIILLAILALNLFSGKAFAESKKDFTLFAPTEKVHNSLYNKLEFVDSRVDTTNLGFVQTGVLNHYEKIFMKEKFSCRLQHLFENMIDSTAQNGVLLFQLRRLKFAEFAKAFSEKGLCSFRANIYEKDSNRYRKLAEIDTVIVLERALVTDSLLQAGARIVYDFVKENLHKVSTDTVSYSYNNVQVIDYFDKQKLKLYSQDRLNDGVYYTYKSFRDQFPDKEAYVKQKDGKISSVKILEFKNDKTKKVKVKPKDIYAVVDNGKAYIATKFGYYPLIKSNYDFYYRGKATAIDVVRGSFFVFFPTPIVLPGGSGLSVGVNIGSLFGGSQTRKTSGKYQMKIDYKTGIPIKVKKLSN